MQIFSRPRPPLAIPSLVHQTAAGRIIRAFTSTVIVLLVLLPVVPYSTGLIAYSYNVSQSLPVRPMYYSLGTSALLAATIFRRRPIISWPALLLLLIMTLRFLDAVVFGRIANITYSPVISTAGPCLFGWAYFAASGNRKELRIGTIAAAFLTLAIVCSLNMYEWRNPGVFSIVAGRAAGFLGNPNDSAFVIVFMLAAIAAMNLSASVVIPTFIVAGLGVFVTLSRGGEILYLATAFTYLARVIRASRRQLLFGGAITILVLIVVAKAFDFHPVVTDDNINGRMRQMTGSGTIFVNDTDRLTLLDNGIKAFLEQPFLGYGTGAAGLVFEPHNMLVGIGLENGIGSVILYIMGLASLFVRANRRYRRGFIEAVPLTVAVVFSHNLIDSIPYIFCWFVCAFDNFVEPPRTLHFGRQVPQL